MNVDALTTRGRGLGAAVAVVLGLLLGVPSAAQATLSITASPASPRPKEPVTLTVTGDCDDLCGGWYLKVGSQTVDAGTGQPDRIVLSTGFANVATYPVGLTYTAYKLFSLPKNVTVNTSIVVVANRGPTAKFTASPAAPTIGQAITFSDTSTDPESDKLTRAWDLDNDGLFNDGDGSTASRSFPTRGTKTVRLRVTDTYGAESIATQTVTVANVSPTVALNVTPTTAQTGEPVAFSVVGADPDGGTVTYGWDLDGDGVFTDSTAASPPARSYARSGTRTIGVRVTDDDGDPVNSTVQRSQVLTITNRPPAAPTISATPTAVARGENVRLTAAGTDPEGTPLTYGWDFNNDGDFTDATGETVTRPMPSSGVLSAKARATDADGGSAVSGTFTLTADNRTPTASFTFAPGAPVIGQAVAFTDASSDPDGDTITRAWDLDNDGAFDDGTGTTASWTYPTRGPKTVRLEVRDGSGAQAVATRTVTIGNVAPTATLSASATAVDTAVPVTFSVSGADPDGGPVTYSWDLDGDGTFGDSTAASPPARSWPRSGAKTVRVRVTDDDGDPANSTVERSTTITVRNQVPAAPTVTPVPAAPAAGEALQLRAAATDPEGTDLTFAWDLDADGAFDDATGAIVTTTFPLIGDLVARVRVTDADGGTADSPDVRIAGAVVPPLDLGTVTPSGDPGTPFTSDVPVTPAAASAPPSPAAATPPARPPAAAPLRLLRPFPRVRVQGRLTRRGARFTRVTVTGPAGATVSASCRGTGCPFGSASATIGRAGNVRLTKLLGSYRAGATIILRVTRDGGIGKYTRIVVRKGRAPAREDRCLKPSATAPSRCPAN